MHQDTSCVFLGSLGVLGVSTIKHLYLGKPARIDLTPAYIQVAWTYLSLFYPDPQPSWSTFYCFSGWRWASASHFTWLGWRWNEIFLRILYIYNKLWEIISFFIKTLFHITAIILPTKEKKYVHEKTYFKIQKYIYWYAGK